MPRRLTLSILLLIAGLSLCAATTPTQAAYDLLEQQALDQDYRSLGYIVQWDGERGLPRKILDGRFGASMRGKAIGSPEDVSQDFILEHSRLLFGTDDVTFGDAARSGSSFELRLIKSRTSLSGSQVIRQQYSNGVPVEGAIIQVNMNQQGEVMSAISEVDPNIVLFEAVPSISADDAIAATLANVDQPGQTRKTPSAELVTLPEGGVARLAWKTDVPLWSPFSDQVAFVDARTGEVIHQHDQMINCSQKAPFEPDQRIDIDPPVAQPQRPDGFVAGKRVDGVGNVLPANPLNDHPERYGLRDGDPVVGFVENLTLPRLDGTGFLSGPYVDVTNSDQPRVNEPSLVFNFSPDVVNGAFHEVNVYWHVDWMQDYIQTDLGIPNANNRQQPAAAHEGEDDNSSYSPSTGRIRFGDGGVDDSEDGEVVLHEYGHALHDDISGIGGGEAGAISEGFGDYCGAIIGNNPIIAEWDATSYNPGPPPNLRRTDGTKQYPDDLVGQVHADGEIISAAWWELRTILGGVIADQLCIESFFLVTATTTMPDMADAYVQADQAIYGGAHLGAIYSVFGGRGMGPAYLLEINHTPLGDTEDRTGPYAVDTSILHTSPITGPDAVQMHWRIAGDPGFTAVTMTDLGGDMWTADIPGPGADATIEYYLSVVDDQAVTASLPATAPTDVLSFNVGTDFIAPVMTHTPLGDQPLLIWPAEVRATVTDNLGVASVTCDWSLNGVPQGSFPLFVAGGDDYSAEFPIDAASLVFGDIFEYSITAVDGSSAANSVSVGPYSFEIIDAKGVVLILDDDDQLKAGGIKELDDKTTVEETEDRDPSKLGAAAALMSAALIADGYVVTIEQAPASDPATWGNYNFIISSSGASTAPMADSAYRAALVAYVQGGGKIFVEGGEVAYDAASFPGYQEIVDNVIHAFDWDGDNSGPMIEVPGQELHPLRTTPNAVPASIPLNYTGFGDQDSVKPDAEAYVVYGTTDEPLNAGLLVWDDNQAPASAQIVFGAFNMAAVSDPAVADALTQNVAAFLLADEGTADASISGQVLVQNRETHAGVTVTAGGQTATTDQNGNYTISGLFGGTYVVSAGGLAGWETATQTVTLANGENRTGVDFELRPIATINVCNETPVSIPDNNPAGITSDIVITDTGDISNVVASVDITHTYRGDLIVELTSPDGTTVRLHNRSGGSADNLVASYDYDTAPDGPGVMNDFDGASAVGTWTLSVSDNAGLDVGTLNSWCLELELTQEGSVPTMVSGFELANAENGVELRWQALDVSSVESFVVRRILGGVEGLANAKPIAAQPGEIRFLDRLDGVEPGTLVGYVLEAILKDGSRQTLTEQSTIAYRPTMPTVFRLDQNAPNPFNPKTTIRFALPQGGQTTLRIYDVAGRLVEELVGEELPAGNHSYVWEGTDHNGQKVSTGTYYYQIRSGRFVETRSMVLVK